ncbi:DUF5683 domain-containing protein [Porphyromonas endodontalis]
MRAAASPSPLPQKRASQWSLRLCRLVGCVLLLVGLLAFTHREAFAKGASHTLDELTLLPLPIDSVQKDTITQVVEFAPSAPLPDSLQMLPTPEAPLRRNFLATSSHFAPNSTLALLYALIPGGGQFYNRKYWKIPLVLAAATACTYAVSWNARLYNEYHTAYVDFMNENPLEKDSWKGFVPNGGNPADYVGDGNIQSRLKKGTELYRRNRDLSIIVSAAVYLLSIIDAYVDAELFLFDVSPNLSMSLAPSLIAQPWSSTSPSPIVAPGLSYRLLF